MPADGYVTKIIAILGLDSTLLNLTEDFMTEAKF